VCHIFERHGQSITSMRFTRHLNRNPTAILSFLCMLLINFFISSMNTFQASLERNKENEQSLKSSAIICKALSASVVLFHFSDLT